MSKVEIDLKLFDLINSQIDDFECTYPGLSIRETRNIISKDLDISSLRVLTSKLPIGEDPRNNPNYEPARISGSESQLFHKYGEEDIIYKVNDPINRIHGLGNRLNTYIWSIILHNLYCEGLEYFDLARLSDGLVLMKQNVSEGKVTTLPKIERALSNLGWTKLSTKSSMYGIELGDIMIVLSDYGPKNTYLRSDGDIDMFDGTFQVIYDLDYEV